MPVILRYKSLYRVYRFMFEGAYIVLGPWCLIIQVNLKKGGWSVVDGRMSACTVSKSSQLYEITILFFYVHGTVYYHTLLCLWFVVRLNDVIRVAQHWFSCLIKFQMNCFWFQMSWFLLWLFLYLFNNNPRTTNEKNVYIRLYLTHWLNWFFHV